MDIGNLSKNINAKMNSMAERDNVEIIRPVYDENQLLMMGTLFLSGSNDRAFSIDLNWTLDRGHEAIIRHVIDGSSCLSVLIPEKNIKYEEIWNLYKQWMVEKLPLKEVESKLIDMDEQKYS